MSTPASIAGHPIHPMLVCLPIGLWVFSFVSDLVAVLGGGPAWNQVALYTLAGGILGALLAAVPGLIDYLSMSNARAARVARFHVMFNVIGIVVFAVSFWLHWQAIGGPWQLAISGLGIVLLVMAGWLGGELVYRHHVGISALSADASEPGRRP